MKIEAAVITRALVLILALANNFLVMAGMPVIPIEDETINMVVSGVFLIGTNVWAWWKNNSVTKAAREGDKVMKKLKKQG